MNTHVGVCSPRAFRWLQGELQSPNEMSLSSPPQRLCPSAVAHRVQQTCQQIYMDHSWPNLQEDQHQLPLQAAALLGVANQCNGGLLPMLSMAWVSKNMGKQAP